MFKTKLSAGYHAKIAWRNLIKNRLFTFLNLTGLATGLAAVLFIFLWVRDEKSMDHFHANDSRLYQVLGSITLANGIFTQDYTPGPLADAMAKDLPEVERATAVLNQWGRSGVIGTGDKHINAKHYYIDSNFFQVFSYPMIAGDNRRLFSDKRSLLLSDEMAIKLFGSIANSIGKAVSWELDKDPFFVAGVFRSPPANSTSKFDILFNIQLAIDGNPQGMKEWQNSNPGTYIVVKKGTDLAAFNKKIDGYLYTKSKSAVLSLQAAKYSDRYLYNEYENGKQAGGRIGYVRLFSLIAIFILVIACINFMNLSTAKAAKRAKEIGVKKVAGASRLVLVFQYISESMLLVLLSVILALALVLLFLPQFNHVTGKSMSIDWSGNFLLSILAITVITGLIAGSYPAFYLSRFKPVTVLKGSLPSSLTELWVRKGLVVFQFTLSVVFIIAVLTIYKQMKMLQTINLGYSKDNIISIRRSGELQKSFLPFMNDLKKIPGVMNAASIGASMTGELSGRTEFVSWEGKKPGDTAYISAINMDNSVMQMLDIKVAEGRHFSDKFGADSLSMIINEAAVKAMNLKNPIGKTITLWNKTYQVIGVTKDFHYESLYEKVMPCLMRYQQSNYNILAKVSNANQKQTLAAIAELYSNYNPSFPFEFTFLDDNYQAMYVSEQRVASLSGFFAALAIVISCLGLFGLAVFTAEKRKKEIGIRKVIGASVSNIVTMLSSDFLKLVLIAALIAFPLAWWAMNQWLNGFAYRVQLDAMVFITAGASIIGITLLTVSIQSVRAAIANPVKSLRTE